MTEKEYIPTHWVNDSEPDIDAEHLNNMEEGIQGLYKPEFDDSGVIEGITSFPAFLEKVVSKMNPITFYKNFKAGMSFILHAGQLVNNGLCNEPGKYPLDAAFGKNLQDQLTQLNSNLTLLKFSEIAKITSTSEETINTSEDITKFKALYIQFGKGAEDYGSMIIWHWFTNTYYFNTCKGIVKFTFPSNTTFKGCVFEVSQVLRVYGIS